MMLFRLAAARNKAPRQRYGACRLAAFSLAPQSLRLRKSTAPFSAPGSGAVLFQLFLLAEEQGL